MTQRPILIPQMEEEEDKDLELRSEEVKEIMGNPPSWIIRWGSTLAFGVVALFFLVGWFIEWPDTRTATIELTTAIPPAEVVSTFDGNIETILVKSGEAVKKGELLAVLQSTGKFEDILYLRDEMEELKKADELAILEYNPEVDFELGELSTAYSILVVNFEDYNRSKTSNYEEKSVSQFEQEKRQVKESIGNLKSVLQYLKNEEGIELKNRKRLQDLYAKGIVSLLELEKSSTTVENVRVRINNARAAISARNRDLSRIDQKIIEFRNTKQKTASFDFTRFTQQINRLQSAIDKWEEKYLLRAPIDGTISFPKETNANQYVKKGEPILNVLPDQGGGWICEGKLPIAGSAKVGEGQDVILKFENYPYAEYGSVRGKVSDIALMPNGNYYRLEVALVDGLNTTFGEEPLQYNQGMTGIAEIVVEEKRLLGWFFEKLVSKIRRR